MTRKSDWRSQTRLLYDAIALHDLARVRELLNHGARVEGNRRYEHTPLMRALAEDDVAIVKELLSRGAAVNATTIQGNTPIVYARARALDLLLVYGAEIDYEDNNGFTPIMKAVIAKDPAKVRWLLRHGASTSKQNASGHTAYDVAVNCRQFAIARIISNWAGTVD